MMFHKLHTPLFVLHWVAFCLTFGSGVFLIVYSHFTSSSLSVMASLRDDYMLQPVKNEIADPNSESENAVRDLRNCMLVIGAISVVISAVILLNIYCFSALMLGEKSDIVKTMTGMNTIRKELMVEIDTMDIQRDY